MSPIVVKQPYSMDYNYSYGQDSPSSPLWRIDASSFAVSRRAATPMPLRAHDMYSGRATEWVEIEPEGKVHAFTVCHFGSEAFLPECPFVLIQVEFKGCDTLFLGRLVGVDPQEADVDWIGEKVAGAVPAQRQTQADRYLFQSGRIASQTMSDPVQFSGELIGWHDPDENRQWVREHKSRKLADKRTAVAEAISSTVPDGTLVAIGGFGHIRVPMALVYELVPVETRPDRGLQPRLSRH